MTHSRTFLAVGVLAAVLATSQMPAEAGQRGGRNGREARAEAGSQSGGRGNQRGTARNEADATQDEARAPREPRDSAPAPRDGGQQDRHGARQDDQRPGARDSGGRNDGRRAEPARPPDRRDAYRYEAPRPAPRVYARPLPRRHYYYGPRGRVELYVGWGSGYRYGSPYAGRVYGYRGPAPSYGYGSRQYYGDVRLEVRPRDAAVYVDGYFAGIVDEFDGVFQRLTLEVGPHRIQIEGPGYEPRSFDVYVDPSHTVDLRGDLYPDRRY